MKNAQRTVALAALSMVLMACGDGGTDKTATASLDLPEDTCAQLALSQVIGEAFGEPELVTDKTEGDKAHCVWIAPATDVSMSGASVEVTLAGATGSALDAAWQDATDSSVAPGDWRPAGGIKKVDVTPKGEWEVADGVDLSLFLATGSTRQLSFRTGRGTNYVVHAAVAMDAKGDQPSPAAAQVADAALAAVPNVIG